MEIQGGWVTIRALGMLYVSMFLFQYLGQKWLVYAISFAFMVLSIHDMRRCIREVMVANLLCVKCGYDLTGNVSGICPECGTPIRKNETAPIDK